MTTASWHKITAVPSGGSVFGISAADGKNLWLCSPAGIFRQSDGVFSHHVSGIPFRSASAVLALGRIVLAAGYPSFIVRSSDNGRTWFRCRAEQVASPVTCFAVSRSRRGGVTLLAGSDGDGILRSTDDGNSWQLSNFGLRTFNVLDIACAPSLAAEAGIDPAAFNGEIVFAATEEGVYQSPNGGRAWRLSSDGLPEVPVLSLAISPDFRCPSAIAAILAPVGSPAHPAITGAVFAGTDGAGLFRSLDGGSHWQAVSPVLVDGTDWSGAAINTLLFTPQGALLAGTSDHGILVSTDLGETWRSLAGVADAVLRLFACDGRLLAGTAERGLLVSEDNGQSWQAPAGFSARQFSSLAGTPADETLFIAGYTEGIWAHIGDEWQAAGRRGDAGWPQDQPVIGLQTDRTALFALTPNRLLAAAGTAQPWKTLFESPVQLTSFVVDGEDMLVGSLGGDVWHSADAGASWERKPPPARSTRISALHLAHADPQGPVFYAATFGGGETLGLWRMDDRGASWQPLLQERTTWQSASLAQLDPAAGGTGEPEILVSAGPDLFQHAASGWQRRTVATPEAPILALFTLPEANLILIARPGLLQVSRDRGATWEDAGLSGVTVTAMTRAASDPRTVLALTSTGAIYRRQF